VLVVVHLLGLLAPGADLISPRLQLYGCSVVCSTGDVAWEYGTPFKHFLIFIETWVLSGSGREGSTSDDLILKCHAFSKKIIKFKNSSVTLGEGSILLKETFHQSRDYFIHRLSKA
jgi:hypothetical protein